MKKIVLIILTLLLIPFFIITIATIDRTPVYYTVEGTVTETHNSYTELNQNTLNEVFNETSLFDTYQLITNEDFSNGTANFTALNGTLTVENGMAKVVGNGLSTLVGIDYNPNISFLYNQKIYIVGYIQLDLTNILAIAINLQLRDSGGNFLDNLTNSVLNTSNNQYISTIHTSNNVNSSYIDYIRFLLTYTSNETQNGKINYFDNIMAFSISTLIANKQYSPLFQTTFDLMSDANIKTQMDEFVAKPYLFIDYDSLGLDDLLISTIDMDYWYNVYQTYGSTYDYITLGTMTAGTYTTLQTFTSNTENGRIKLYRDGVIDETVHTIVENIDSITISKDDETIITFYPDDTYISENSTVGITYKLESYTIDSYIDGSFDNTILAFVWIIPILLIGGFFFVIFSHRKED